MKYTFLLTKKTSLFLLFFIIAPISMAQYSGGNGTISDPYQIGNFSDLQTLSNTNTHWGSYFIQTANIDATSSASLNAGAGFSPIGNDLIAFSGSYDGQNNTISGLFINRPTRDSIGLFGYANINSTIKNLGLTNLAVIGNDDVGGLIGFLEEGVISNCYSSGNVSGYRNIGVFIGQNMNGNVNDCYSEGSVDGNQYVGGLIGINYGGIVTDCHSSANVSSNGMGAAGGLIGSSEPLISGNVSGCYSTGDVEGTDWAGGLIGFVGMQVTISDCYSTSSVLANNYVGGLMGYVAYGSSITSCHSTGNTIGEEYVGGLVGIFEEATLSKSYSISNVSGTNWIGGLIGFVYPYTIIENCYAIGSVNGESKVGGLIGELDGATLNYSYSAGSIFGTSETGGLIGKITGLTTITNSFWDVTSSLQSTSASGSGITTSMMQTESTFTLATWDFVGETANGSNDIWQMGSLCTFNNYPVFSWQTLVSLPSNIVTQNNNTLTAVETGATYKWLDCNNANIAIAGATSQSFTPTLIGNYAVEVTKNGCTDTSSCINITTHVLEKTSLETFNVYPNPTSDIINISSKSIGQSYTVTDNIGKLIHSGLIVENFLQYNLEDQKPGVYFLKIENKVVKIIKR